MIHSFIKSYIHYLFGLNGWQPKWWQPKSTFNVIKIGSTLWFNTINGVWQELHRNRCSNIVLQVSLDSSSLQKRGVKTGKDMWHLKQLTGSISPFNSSLGVSKLPWLQVFSNNFVEIHLTFMKHIFCTLHKNKNSLYCVSWLARIEAWGKQQTDSTKNVNSPQHQYKSMWNEPDKKS